VAACEKPAPQVTVASSGRVINVDASHYCRGKVCRDFAAAAKSIRVRGDTTVSFDVPKRVAQKGWMLRLGTQDVFAEPRHDSHYRLSIPTVGGKQPLPVTIGETGTGTDPSGVWQMQFLIQE
jgi:hypothetical protein